MKMKKSLVSEEKFKIIVRVNRIFKIFMEFYGILRTL